MPTMRPFLPSSSLAFTTGIMEGFLLLSDFEAVHPAVFEANLASYQRNPRAPLITEAATLAV